MSPLIRPRLLFVALALLLLASLWASLAFGPINLPLLDTLNAGLRLIGLPLAGDGLAQAELILGEIRLPRTLLGVLVGAVLALCGVAMQGLFRNPLADPGLIGVASGAALGASLAIVGGSALVGGLPKVFEPYVLSLFAFIGGLGVTALVYSLGRRNGETNVATMLLAGIAFTALSGAVIGLFTYLADDATLRSLTSWGLGSLNGASYARLWPLLIVTAAVALWLPRRARALNALLLGESEARHLVLHRAGSWCCGGGGGNDRLYRSGDPASGAPDGGARSPCPVACLCARRSLPVAAGGSDFSTGAGSC
jgi:iron complex transport system permease protein